MINRKLNRKQLIKVTFLALCTVLLLTVAQVSLAADSAGEAPPNSAGEVQSKKQTPVQVIVQIAVTAVILKGIEPWIMP
jgi:secreted PhoX family phosphatase